MKHIIITIAALAAASAAHAGGGHHQPVQKPAGAHAEAESTSVSKGGSASAYGGAGGTSTLAGSGNGTATAGSVTDASSASYRNLNLWLPNPLNVPQITPATAACALSQSEGVAVGWNFYSQTSARQTIDGLCIAERQAAALEAQCKFRTAAALRAVIAREAAKAIPGFGEAMEQAGATPWVNERDLSLEECTRPPKVEREIVYVDRPVPAPQPPVVVVPAPEPRVVTRTVYRDRVPCYSDRPQWCPK